MQHAVLGSPIRIIDNRNPFSIGRSIYSVHHTEEWPNSGCLVASNSCMLFLSFRRRAIIDCAHFNSCSTFWSFPSTKHYLHSLKQYYHLNIYIGYLSLHRLPLPRPPSWIKQFDLFSRVARSTHECKAKQYQKKNQTNFNIFFIFTSHEKIQTHVITILPTGMSGTYGISLVRCEVF